MDNNYYYGSWKAHGRTDKCTYNSPPCLAPAPTPYMLDSDNECRAFVHFHKSCFLSTKTTICKPLSCHSNSSQSLCEKDTASTVAAAAGFSYLDAMMQ